MKPVIALFLALIATWAVMSLTGCAGSGDNPLGTPLATRTADENGHCKADYVSERNAVVEKVNLAFVNVETLDLMAGERIGNTHDVNTTQSISDIRATADALDAFLAKNRDVACVGLVLKCKPEFESDYHCYLNPSQSDYVDERITNDELQTALTSLRAYLAKNAAAAT